MTPNQKGEIAELRVQLRAVEKGYIASRPAVASRYDLIIDTGTELLRTQVKYADTASSHATGSVLVGLRPGRERGQRRNKHVYCVGQIDLILVYIAKVDKIACLKPEVFSGRSSLTIRFEQAKNVQLKAIRRLEDILW